MVMVAVLEMRGFEVFRAMSKLSDDLFNETIEVNFF